MTTTTNEACIKGNFSDREDKYIFGCWVGFPPMSRASHKGSGERGTFHTWWVKQLFDIFVKKGDNWYVIMGDNQFYTKGLSFNRAFSNKS